MFLAACFLDNSQTPLFDLHFFSSIVCAYKDSSAIVVKTTDLSAKLNPKFQQGSTYIIQWTHIEEQTAFIIEAVGLGKLTILDFDLDLIWFGLVLPLHCKQMWVCLKICFLSVLSPAPLIRTRFITVHVVSSWSEPRQHSKQGISLSLGTEYASLSSTGQNPGCQDKYPDDKGPNSQCYCRFRTKGSPK